MRIEHGRLIEATEDELQKEWADKYEEIMTFEEFVRLCERYGTAVTKRGVKCTKRSKG